MIRPRAGGFVCGPPLPRRMIEDIERMRRLGADGVVLGCLTADDRVDLPSLGRLVEAARPLAVTFHRAFDRCAHRSEAIEALVEAGVDRVLTAGGGASQADAAGLRATLDLAGGRIGIIAAGGIRAGNVVALVMASGVREIHFSERLGAPEGPDRAAALAAAIARIVGQVRQVAGR
jgi:copper homeostasis protein